MLNVSICCNDDNGLFTGRATRIDFHEYELTVEDTLWPAKGVKIAFDQERSTGHVIKFGGDIWRPCDGLGGFGGNLFWRCLRLRGVDCIGLMNYLMTLKYWHATEGECYLFDCFNDRKRIVPKEFFASRERGSQGGSRGTLDA